MAQGTLGKGCRVKTSGIAYPRREDAVRYEEFDGTLEAAQRIANLTGAKVTARLEPSEGYRAGDTVRIGSLSLSTSPTEITNDHVVVVSKKPNQSPKVTVYDRWTFADKFSKDGN